MFYIIYNSTTGLIVGGPLVNQQDANRLVKPNEEILEVPTKHIKRLQQRIDTNTFELRDWTPDEIANRIMAEQDGKIKRNNARTNLRNDKANGVNQTLPAMKVTLDNLLKLVEKHSWLDYE